MTLTKHLQSCGSFICTVFHLLFLHHNVERHCGHLHSWLRAECIALNISGDNNSDFTYLVYLFVEVRLKFVHSAAFFVAETLTVSLPVLQKKNSSVFLD